MSFDFMYEIIDHKLYHEPYPFHYYCFNFRCLDDRKQR